MSPLRHQADKLPRPPFVRGKADLLHMMTRLPLIAEY
jgi:hypothetical protein